jgi:hypothetical protein
MHMMQSMSSGIVGAFAEELGGTGIPGIAFWPVGGECLSLLTESGLMLANVEDFMEAC